MTDQFLPSYPDWGIYPKQQPGTEPDLGEIAARLGGLSTYRRTGRLIYQDNFVNLNGWNLATDCWSSALHVINGPSCLKLRDGTVTKYMPKVLQTVGSELSLYPEWQAINLFPLFTEISYRNSNTINNKYFSVLIYWNLLRIRILPVTGVPLNVYTIPTLSNLYVSWHNFKVSFDVANNTYGWLHFDDVAIDLRSYSPFTDPASFGNCDVLSITNSPAAPGTQSCFITDLLVTTNETMA